MQADVRQFHHQKEICVRGLARKDFLSFIISFQSLSKTQETDSRHLGLVVSTIVTKLKMKLFFY